MAISLRRDRIEACRGYNSNLTAVSAWRSARGIAIVEVAIVFAILVVTAVSLITLLNTQTIGDSLSEVKVRDAQARQTLLVKFDALSTVFDGRRFLDTAPGGKYEQAIARQRRTLQNNGYADFNNTCTTVFEVTGSADPAICPNPVFVEEKQTDINSFGCFGSTPAPCRTAVAQAYKHPCHEFIACQYNKIHWLTEGVITIPVVDSGP